MTYISAVVFLVLVGASLVLGDVSITSCARDSANELLTIPYAHLSPYPIRIPGTERVSGTLKLNRAITEDMSLSLYVQRKVTFFWVKLPCVKNFGSCSFGNLCSWLKALTGNGCPAAVREAGLPCNCPIPKGTYSVTDMTYDIPKLTGPIAALADGDFRVTATVKDSAGREIACQKVEATLTAACSGFLCGIFG